MTWVSRQINEKDLVRSHFLVLILNMHDIFCGMQSTHCSLGGRTSTGLSPGADKEDYCNPPWCGRAVQEEESKKVPLRPRGVTKERATLGRHGGGRRTRVEENKIKDGLWWYTT